MATTNDPLDTASSWARLGESKVDQRQAPEMAIAWALIALVERLDKMTSMLAHK